MKKSDLEEG
jgi:hypothetical protein